MKMIIIKISGAALILMLLVFGSNFYSCEKSDKVNYLQAVNDTVISGDGVPVVFTVRGKVEPALVFIHGWSCDRSYWDAQVDTFMRYYKIITIDLAGHGESGMDRENWTIEAFGEDVVSVISTLGLKQVILIGHSMGGSVIIEVARNIPEKVIGIIGVDTYQDFERKYTKEQFEKFLEPFKNNFSETTKSFVKSMFYTDADSVLVEKITNDMASATPEVALSAFENYFSYDQKNIVNEINIPIRCINSDKYPVNVEGNKKYASSFNVRIIPGVGHFIMMENPAAFNELLFETIKELFQESSN